MGFHSHKCRDLISVNFYQTQPLTSTGDQKPFSGWSNNSIIMVVLRDFLQKPWYLPWLGLVIFLLTPNPSNQLSLVTRVTPSLVIRSQSSHGMINLTMKMHQIPPLSNLVGNVVFFWGGGDVCFPFSTQPKKNKPSQSKKNHWKNFHRPMATESSFHVLLGRCDLPRIGSAEAPLDWRHRGSRGRRVEAEWEGGGCFPGNKCGF